MIGDLLLKYIVTRYCAQLLYQRKRWTVTKDTDSRFEVPANQYRPILVNHIPCPHFFTTLLLFFLFLSQFFKEKFSRQKHDCARIDDKCQWQMTTRETKKSEYTSLKLSVTLSTIMTFSNFDVTFEFNNFENLGYLGNLIKMIVFQYYIIHAYFSSQVLKGQQIYSSWLFYS